ncbi:MAG: undecaprenyl/decaprenyl-phosphate alpha-N-acetylglucosaminyl 1-phosphate transferase [Sedimentisphaerales bacterium]|nr:undecaprenyl/decaprenyl-phosphate alpha-N-acetylglucosaminyl 1-phosphate transferase [Sedimentisphaerales bacterium]
MPATLYGHYMIVTGAAIVLAVFAVGVVLVSQMCRWSWRWGAVDRPDGSLKCHSRPTATLGGLPLYGAVVCGTVLVMLTGAGQSAYAFGRLGWQGSWSALLAAGLILMSVGISDDLRRVMPRTKLLFQILAATILIGSGLVIHRCSFFGVFELSMGILAVPFTLFWLVGSCNAFNFIDGLDGLASGLGILVALLLAGFGWMNGSYGPALCALVVAAALLAILCFNLKPACIFLGDSGSQLLGLLLGALAIETTTTVGGAFQLPAAGLVLSIPVFDALLSILRRYSQAESLACGDHRHIHHCLRRLGLSERRVALTLWLVTGICGAMAYLSQIVSGVVMGLAALLFILLELYVGIRLGCLSLSDLRRRLGKRPAAAPDVPPAVSLACSMPTAVFSNRLEEVEDLWERMKPHFERMHLDRAVLTLEGVGEKGPQQRQIYQWVRSQIPMAELLRSRWTKRFSLDESRVATLRLESASQLRQQEEHIDWLVRQISNNVRSAQRRPATAETQPVEVPA